MGLLEDVVRGLIKVFCGGSRPEADKPQYGQPNAPPHQQQQQQQQQGYPPLQHQQQSGYPGANAHQGQTHGPNNQSHGKPHHKPQHTQEDRPQHQSSPAHGKPHSPDHHASSPPPHQGSPSGHKPYHGQDPNQVNQHNEHYMGLRAKANQEGDAMGKCFDQSHSAYSSGDGARAKELSEQGKAHQREMERLNEQASEWIFRENNTDSKPGEIDLHGLYVKEAIQYTDRSIQEARQRGDSEIHLIVGKGLHSAGHVAKIKPAIEDLMRKHNLVAALDPHNAGVLIVRLDGQTRGGERSIGVDDISRKLERDEEQCVIM